MSVIFFQADELGNVARAALEGIGLVGFDAQKYLERTCEKLAVISRANVKAYANRYPASEKPKAITAAAILAAAREARADLNTATGTGELLAYNCREDKDYLALTRGGREALIYILEALLQANTRARTEAA